MGLIRPEKDFLSKLRQICTKEKSLLIFDEVITGFRFHAGAYSSLINISPDLTVFGKIIGGGMPIGAVAGKNTIMEQLAPLGSVYQAGTLSGNPVALNAGIATLKELRDNSPYSEIEILSDILETAVNDIIQKNNLKCKLSCYKGVFTLFFNDQKNIQNLSDVKKCDLLQFSKYHNFMLSNGVYISPSQFEVNFISASHSKNDIEKTISLISKYLSSKQQQERAPL